MIYIINKNIYFRNTDGALWIDHYDDSSVITMTVTTSRLLTYLLERQGEVAERENILESVWDSYGLKSSSNSLNKYIADLRKIFHNVGLTESVILTVPKIGFMFSREIEVVKEETFDDTLPKMDAISDPSAQPKKRVKGYSKRTMVTCGIVLLIVGFSPALLVKQIFALNIMKQYELPQKDTFLLGNISGCRVMTMQQSSTQMTKVKLDIANRIISKSKMECLPQTVLYFQPSDPVVYGYTGRVFLSRCTFNKDNTNKFAACKNYYMSDYTYER